MWTTFGKALLRSRVHQDGILTLLKPYKGRSLCTRSISSQNHWYNRVAAAQVYRMTPVIQNVKLLDKEYYVSVQWEDGSQSVYPYVWLRDNCQCPNCFLHSAKARKFLLADLDVNTGIEKVVITNETKISVVWPDQHISEFDADWLYRRNFSKYARKELQEELYMSERQYWGSNLQIPTISFEEVLTNDTVAYKWLTNLRKLGVVLLKGVGTKQGEVAKLAKRIGFLRLTFYGHTWQVEDKVDANNVAYTSGKLSFHTDYPALHYPPGVQFLHCIKQADVGGESELVDGFYVANKLKEQNPEAFSILSSTLVDYTDTGSDYCDFALQSKNRIIDVDRNGQVVRINYNNATRDSVFDLPVEQVQPFYAALKELICLMNKPEYKYTYKMEPGDLVTFDNWRLLHGRRSYTSTSAGGGNTRLLEGAYLDWDEVMSRLRVLKQAVYNGN
ncbi:gamma-butyrobetaine dioxygenase [Latimeria chalumnae]|uniref:gamma-butyrobetaine dioxygenase n=1 Tax=Latimeria chalumnae TaxID=7897 RepID=H3B1E9_LATCH|nr:PREDICTED: gamma-butyrobetaine dioxygenase [Latimeria chalumnae]XP_005995132.1 PREDICTED: gamma-butyrobetaine dioxygenase [Latimeria chalumnae]XP_014343363.1 PREDICTED: gamma-butyrobetaine dioxygenase [Latimeria chalumnae]XP_014343364.1 PREDICTED: gamma-butyrobetaine dioxygenase [Latimeria chalumnae]|eukprot:XP_005995131.1 PREDICTED: gamma-butyrobetaine dioxygenase [Latimeria chalumnae]